MRRDYAKTRYDIPLFKLHEMDPTKVKCLFDYSSIDIVV